MASNPVASTLLAWAHSEHSGEVEVLPLLALVVDSSRENDKRPAKLVVSVPDDWVKNIAGYDQLQDVYLVSRVPRELFQEWDKASREAGSQQPTEALAG